MTEPRWSFEKESRAWSAAMTTLNEAGWKAELHGIASPVQVLGVLPCGEEFYFRSRHDVILLAVGGDDPSDRAPWEREVHYGEPGDFAASYLPAEPGLRVLLDLATQHQADCPLSAGPPAD